jgi:hypothetical protein
MCEIGSPAGAIVLLEGARKLNRIDKSVDLNLVAF